jgi:hypothetical protein
MAVWISSADFPSAAKASFDLRPFDKVKLANSVMDFIFPPDGLKSPSSSKSPNGSIPALPKFNF